MQKLNIGRLASRVIIWLYEIKLQLLNEMWSLGEYSGGERLLLLLLLLIIIIFSGQLFKGLRGTTLTYVWLLLLERDGKKEINWLKVMNVK